MENVKKPKFIESRIDVKAATVTSFDLAIKKLKDGEEPILGKNAKVYIFTSFGMIDGTLVSQDKDNEAKDSAAFQIADVIRKARDNYLAEAEREDSIIVNNIGMLTLINASITPFANQQAKFNVGFLQLFTDQICGITFGELGQQKR